MRNTKAYMVIHVKKMIRICLVVMLCFFLLWAACSESVGTYLLSAAKKRTLEREVYTSVSPLFAVQTEEGQPQSAGWLNILLNKRLEEPASLLAGELIAVSGIREKLAELHQYVNEGNFYFTPPKKTPSPVRQENPAAESTISSFSEKDALGKKGITVRNSTTYQPDYEALFREPLKMTKPEKGQPQILIVHTHGTESYNPDTRSEDTANNMIRIGDEMEQVFQEKGIGVVHSHTLHDIPHYNNSYGKALDTIEAVLKKHPSIQVVLDVHRDAMTTAEGELRKVVTEINGKKAAQVMLVVGTNQMGLPNDHWHENLKFAMKCQEAICRKYPGLTRPIDLRQERFNMHATNGSLIIEVGTHGNTIEEAMYAARCTAEAISEVLR